MIKNDHINCGLPTWSSILKPIKMMDIKPKWQHENAVIKKKTKAISWKEIHYVLEKE